MFRFLRPAIFACQVCNIGLRRINFCVRLLTNFQDECFVNNPFFIKYLESLQKEYNDLLSHNTRAECQNTNRRISELKPIINILHKRQKLEDDLNILEEINAGADKDEELQTLTKEERQTFCENIKALDAELLDILVPEDPQDRCSKIVLEVLAGVGGQEAMLFAAELLNMYKKFTNFKGWDSQVIEYDEAEAGGVRHASLLVSGENAFQYLKHEVGVHRVQRVPATEKSGRIHTSTVSVSVLPEPEDCEIVLNDKDLRVETKCASGPGGQHVNKTESAVRITHIPTNITVECQEERSQLQNKQQALKKLKRKLYHMQLDKQIAETKSARKQQIGTRMRSEKIRTYNFNQDRITDHRIKGSLHNMKGFFTGQEDLNGLILNLQSQDHKDKVLKMLENCK